MDILNGINLLAVLAAAVSAFALGGAWYSPAMFLKPWLADAGMKSDSKESHPARVFGVSFAFALVSAFAFACWLGPAPPFGHAVLSGLAVGGLFVAASFGINYQFANRSVRLWLIDGGYHTVQFGIYGLVLGLWH